MKNLSGKGTVKVMEIFSISLSGNFKLIFHYLYKTGETILDVVECGDVPKFYQISETPDDIKGEINSLVSCF